MPYSSTNENIKFKVYIGKGEFELAKQYCKDNPAHIDQVLVKQAEMLFNQRVSQKLFFLLKNVNNIGFLNFSIVYII